MQQEIKKDCVEVYLLSNLFLFLAIRRLAVKKRSVTQFFAYCAACGFKAIMVHFY